MLAARHVVLSPEQAHRVLEYDYSAPPRVVWDWFNDPRKRGLWMHSQILPVLGRRGRFAAGAQNHCVHGKNEIVIEDVLDVRPFEYYTVDHRPRGNPVILRMTFHFEPSTGGGTHFRLTLACRGRHIPEWADRLLTDYVVRNNVKRLWSLDQIDDLISEERSAA
jgi:uncharacterized protein YndB with AHSA1/START domain